MTQTRKNLVRKAARIYGKVITLLVVMISLLRHTLAVNVKAEMISEYRLFLYLFYLRKCHRR